MAEIADEYIRKNALIDFLVDMSTLEMYADVEEGIRLCIRWIKSIPPVRVRYVPDKDVGEFAKDTNVPCKYDPDAFFSAERYPLPMKCSECGKTMRPVHKHYVPDLPRTYFCTFCGVGIYEDNPGIRFQKRQTNADRIRQMSDEELAAWLGRDCPEGRFARGDETEPGCKDFGTCRACWLEWLQQEVDTNDN